MLIIAIISFLAAIVCGLVLFIAILQDRPTNKIAKTLHGLFAAIGLIILIVYMLTDLTGESSLLNVSLVVLLLAALGGLFIFTMDRKKKKIPKLVILIHPLIALAGLIALIIYVLP